MTTLDDVCVAIVDCEHKTAPKAESGHPSIRTTNKKNGRIDFDGANKVSEETYEYWTKRRRPMPGDLILAREAPVGEVGLIPEGIFPVLGQRTVLLSPDVSKVEPRYLHYLLISPDLQHTLEVRSAGSTVHHLNMKDIRALELPELPELPEQREIAAILGALDDKIELNRKTAATLEAMARALYRSWFVDFDPVWAKTEGRPPAHMDAATAALFPDSFGDEGLPVGWEVKSLSSIATFLNGAALQKFPPKESEDSLPVIKIAELRNGVTASSNRASADLPAKYRIQDGDVLFSWSGSLLQKVWTNGSGALNQHLFKVSSDLVPKWFHYFAVDQHMEDFREIAHSKATTMGHIQRHHLDEAMVSLPADEIISAADRIMSPLFERIVALELENKTLATLRDTLLPRLMSGELRVGEAREQAEAVA